MPTLLLLRHAKSSWKDTTLADHDRPLKGRGKRAAPMMGRLLVDQELVPDLIISSTAVRAKETARLAAKACGYRGEIITDRALYLAEPEGMLAVLREHGRGDRVMLVAHNPGMEDLIERLTGEFEVFPTAALAQIELSVPSWEACAKGVKGRLVHLWRPKELEPAS